MLLAMAGDINRHMRRDKLALFDGEEDLHVRRWCSEAMGEELSIQYELVIVAGLFFSYSKGGSTRVKT